VSGFADDAKREGDWADDPREDAPAPPARPAHFWPLFDGAAAHSECFADARDYVLGRGLELRTVKAAGVGACTRGDWAGRIIVPITSPEGGWLWHVGRAWSPAAVRPYMYPRGARKGLLYNASALARESDEPVLVVEGVFDALAHWPDAVAVLGKPTEEHIEALAAARRPVCVVLDGDAWREGEALAMRLQLEGQRAGHVKLGPRQDPDEVSRAEMRARARKSLGLAA
jgi:DNA primase